MPEKIEILPLEPDSELLDEIAVEARAEGYAFVDRLIDEAKSGENRFDRKGENFCGAFIDGALVGCGGLNIDPYTDRKVGRLRHVFILSRSRRMGVAHELVQHLINRSSAEFSEVRLRTSDQKADKFYEAIGFNRTTEEGATHKIQLSKGSSTITL